MYVLICQKWSMALILWQQKEIGEELIILQMIGQQARYKQIKALMKETPRIRNVSIVAHVDHGKTTLADCLISSNGIINKKQAGHLLLLDDRLDEQDRGITMKASSIALLHRDHLINLIDSPGHLEFYSEVSAALRVTDAALLVVDTVEGVSSQTYRVLNQLYTQKLPAILVLNKIDKLITQCRMEPLQAYQHLNQLIEHVNAILGSFISKEVGTSTQPKTSEEDSTQPMDALESYFYFSVEKKNVVFSSALDNWGFSVQSFSGLISKKLGKKPEQIQKYLWGDYYFNPKTKSFSNQPRNDNERPLCVDWILKPVWDIFENVENGQQEKLSRVITALNLKITQSAKKARGYAYIKEILNSWLPLDRVLLDKIINQLPNPIQAQRFRLPYLLHLNKRQQKLPKEIQQALSLCPNSPEAPLIAFVSKIVTLNKKQINERGLNYEYQDSESIQVGFGRIFSGRVRRGQEVLVIGAKPKKVTSETGQISQIPDIVTARVSGLYFFNGQYPQGVEEAYAGNVVGFTGLENQIFKSGTISSSKQCLSFLPVSSQTKSILKVSVSTPDIKNGPKLLQGLKKLNRSDPSVDVYVQGTGDIILNTCGQVHLQKCIVDLQTIYCKVPIKTSDPIITFREAITWSTLSEIKNQKQLQQTQKKRLQMQKKVLMEQYKADLRADAQLDEDEKEKQRAMREWDSHVQKYDSEDLTVQDTRFFFKNRDDIDEYSEAFVFKREREFKKVDHKNKGKMHIKQKFLNLNRKTNLVVTTTPNLKLSFKVRAIAMPFLIAEFLQKQSENMTKCFSPANFIQKFGAIQDKFDNLHKIRNELLDKILAQFQEHNLQQPVKKLILEKMICFGPNHNSGTNILVADCLKSSSFITKIRENKLDLEESEFNIDQSLRALLQEYKTTPAELITAIKNGFWLACASGPLANQQMMGVIFIIQSIKAVVAPKIEKLQEQKKEQIQKQQQKIQEQQSTKAEEQFNVKAQPSIELKEQTKLEKQSKNQTSAWATDNFGPLAGQVISTTKQACLQSFLGAGPRLVEPMYLCQLHTDQQYYGSIHNELSKRRAQVISEDLHEFSNFFIIKAYLPMLESTNFCFDVLDKTQGTVNAQLDLDTWKVIEEDPFFVPSTLEQLEQNGLDKKLYNQARLILEKIRQKKGLVGSEKIVVAAEKQRTLKKN